MRYLVILVLMLGSLASPARAADAAEEAAQRLRAALKNLDNISAEFKQTLLDEDKNIVQQSRGTMALQRPGKFAWIYTEPFEQRIIGDGKELWIYDVELEQVTVKPMDAGISNAPIMILMKQTDVTQQFDVSEVGAQVPLLGRTQAARQRPGIQQHLYRPQRRQCTRDGAAGSVWPEHPDRVRKHARWRGAQSGHLQVCTPRRGRRVWSRGLTPRQNHERFVYRGKSF